jgi:hypothetical protein
MASPFVFIFMPSVEAGNSLVRRLKCYLSAKRSRNTAQINCTESKMDRSWILDIEKFGRARFREKIIIKCAVS